MSEGNPLVSVVLTIYNGEDYFDRAIPAILEQTYDNFEFIIVDDGSDDSTPELLEKVASGDERVRILSGGRMGRAAALNYGIKESNGKYIAIQDIDDISYPRRLSLQVDFLESNNDIGVIGGYYNLIDENRSERYIRKPPVKHEDIIKSMSKYIPMAHTLATLRKAAWKEAGGYPDVDNIIDLRMWIRIAEKGWKLANIPEVIGEHWVYQDSSFNRAFKYKDRQRELAGVQASAVKKLGLAKWRYIYPAARYIYPYIPDGIKRVIRRTIAGLKEENI